MPTFVTIMQLPYKEFLKEVLAEAPTNCTWMEVSNWLLAKYTKEQISEMYCKLHRQLVELTPDDDPEDPDADWLRDQMDVFWYTADSELIEKWLKETFYPTPV